MDNRTPEQRRSNMQHIHSKDTKIEIILRKALHKEGIRYRKNYKDLPGKPDIAITKYKIAVFCDSEFFHGKDWETQKIRLLEGSNGQYWVKKIEKTIERDADVEKKLKAMDWLVFRFWGKEIKYHTEECVQTIKEAILYRKVQC